MDDAVYDGLYPYHAEICALSELRKKPGFGVPVRSGIGGHCLLYLNGVRRDHAAGYPVLKLCAPDDLPARHGVAISVNSHYKNANWVAAEGRAFVWRGALPAGARLDRAAYARTQDHAKATGMLDGVQFHEHLFRDKPAGMTDRDYMYEISVATDYAVCFGREAFRARMPLDHARMGAIVDFLNALNAPYRSGDQVFHWRLFNNNCVHVAHNALAQAGVWAPWPTGQFAPFAMFKFPVPKNAFVDLMRRGNDLPVADTKAMYEDAAARRALLEGAGLPTRPGALAVKAPAIRDNDVYNTEKLRLIFFDNPYWGPYRKHLVRIFKEPRYQDLRANLQYFSDIYQTAANQTEVFAARPAFETCHAAYIAGQAEQVRRSLARLDPAVPLLAETVS